MFINSKNNSTIWHYQVMKDQIYTIFKYGLEIKEGIDLFSELQDNIILKIDIKDIDQELIKYIDNNHIKIFTKILPEYISV